MNGLISIVIIGRNEGERLVDCLESVRAATGVSRGAELIYVDSNSSDRSPEQAVWYGAKVIVLNTGKMSAAAARNAGWRATTSPFVLFLDGDTVLDPYFPDRALREFADREVAVVWGHRREISPKASVYNRVLDLDWIARPGYSDFCGGDSIMRRRALELTNGFDPSLIAGEEPDLCRRIRGKGGKVLHIDAPMTRHDLALLHLSQYWKRAVRTGHAYAEVSARYRDSPDPLWTRESRGNFLRGSLYLLVVAGALSAAALMGTWTPLIALIGCGLLLAAQTAFLVRWKRASWITLLLFGIHSHLQQVPILHGQVLYFWARWRGQHRELIEYKSS